MIERGWGRLILVTSIAGELAVPGASSYIAAKGGLAALARALAAELGAKGITTNALSPGFFATETNAQMMTSPMGERQRERCPAKRWAEPAEIAGAACSSPRRRPPTSTATRWWSMAACRRPTSRDDRVKAIAPPGRS
jgi:gluconate 5-dehydrogenase